MQRDKRNRVVALASTSVVVGMVGMSFAAVPLYDLFCRVTGYGGTTQRSDVAPDTVVERVVTIRFNADTQTELPWRFRPEQRAIEVRVGENGLAFYSAENLSDSPVVGRAVYNVTPQKAGIHFSKIACFCFEEQYLAPHQRVDMPVSFYVDPAFADDPGMSDVSTITLSYTFFDAGEEGLREYLRSHPDSLAAGDGTDDPTIPEGS